MITQPLRQHEGPAFTRLFTLIRSADVAFTNLETQFHDYESHAMHLSGGTYMRSDPALAQELAWAGFDLLSRANNHAGDYGVAAMALTSQHVADVGLVQAGVGRDLDAARQPGYWNTESATVALISAASTFPDHARAGNARGRIPPRPGLNPLRFQVEFVLSRRQMEQIRSIRRSLNFRTANTGDELLWLRHQFTVGRTPRVRTTPNQLDLEEISNQVRRANQRADHVVVSIHAHESGRNRFEPPEFLVSFAHAMIDAGADVVVGHGPHLLRGIEIYNSKPILYSLGNFIYQNETVDELPADNYESLDMQPDATVEQYNQQMLDVRDGHEWNWHSLVVVCHWQGSRLQQLKLHPLVIESTGATRGVPRIASLREGTKIVRDLQRHSSIFDTRIDLENFTVVVPTGE